jgi:hypothetical protein
VEQRHGTIECRLELGPARDREMHFPECLRRLVGVFVAMFVFVMGERTDGRAQQEGSEEWERQRRSGPEK